MNHRGQTARHWYDKHYATFGPSPLMPWGRKILHHFIALRVPPEAHVIDLGCGDGALLAALRTVAGHHPGSLWGIEQSRIAASQAIARCPGSNIIVGDLLALPLRYGVYRVAILAEVIEHLNDQ
ncbi:MAG TPA: class I SAM-dependent methyltransferase [Ktedonobacteraceae bacterium]|nr:class I SAM-dependent methyltransferase [Ktedonobacteraceae bacterium]